MLQFLGLGNNVEISIALDDEKCRKTTDVHSDDGLVSSVPIYYDGETLSGNVFINIKRGNKLEHQGILIEFLGVMDFYTDRNNRDEFLSFSQDLARPGILSSQHSYPFEFTQIAKPHESYYGSNIRLRYLLRVVVHRRLSDQTKEREIFVHSLFSFMDPDTNIQMEVGIEDSLHIEFDYNKSRYHLNDVIIGRISFLLVRVKVKMMELQILKRETLNYGANTFGDTDIVCRFEIMDGSPIRGEFIPIRLYLRGHGLTPTMRDNNRKFSVRYYLNLVLLDEENRRYFKQQEIILYRKSDMLPTSRQPTELNHFQCRFGTETNHLDSEAEAVPKIMNYKHVTAENTSESEISDKNLSSSLESTEIAKTGDRLIGPIPGSPKLVRRHEFERVQTPSTDDREDKSEDDSHLVSNDDSPTISTTASRSNGMPSSNFYEIDEQNDVFARETTTDSMAAASPKMTLTEQADILPNDAGDT